MIHRSRRLFVLAALVAVESSGCTAMLGANDPIEIINPNPDEAGTGDGQEPSDDAAQGDTADSPEPPDGNGGDSEQADVEADVDAFAPLPDTGPPPPPDSSVADAPAACVPAANVPSSDVPAWQGVTEQLNECSSSQLMNFTTVCLSGGNPTACSTWQGDPTNATCMSCLFGPTTRGAFVSTAAQGLSFANLPGCIDLVDTSPYGASCAAQLEPSMQCDLFACQSCNADSTMLQECIDAVNASGGACASYYGASQSACATEYADGGAATTACSSVGGVLDVICGSGP